MAFVAVLPAVGSAVLPALGTILTTGAGIVGSGLGALGGAMSSIPLIGGSLGSALGGIGSGIGALGGGLGGGLGMMGAGNIAGGLSTALGGLTSGLGAAGGGLFTGADMMLGGLLPNIAGAGITPAAGYLGQGGLGLLGNAASSAATQVPLGSVMPGGTTSGAMAESAMGNLAGGVMPGGTTGGAGVGLMDGLGVTAEAAQAAGGNPITNFLDRGKDMLGGIKAKVDPVLGPLTETGMALGQGMDIYNKFTGRGQPQQGYGPTPAQAAQIPTHNPYIPTQKSTPKAMPVNVGAGATGMMQQAQPGMMPVGGGYGGAPVAYVPMPGSPETQTASEDEVEAFKQLLQGNGNFLTGVQGRMMA